MCLEALSGSGCDFDIHDSCAAHPQTLSSPALHAHQLVLVQTRQDLTHTCDVCAGCCATGAFLYRCPPCGFDMHPSCARLPRTAVRSTLHPGHDLTLVVADGRCAVCHHGAGCGWFYRCVLCNVDLHVSCASGGGEGSNAGARHEENIFALTANLIGARLRQQGIQNALDLVSPPDPEERRRRRRNYFYI